MSAARLAALTELGRALGCTVEIARPGANSTDSGPALVVKRRAPGLPDRCYYQGDEFRVPPPPIRIRDESRAATPSERSARAMIEQDRAELRRFFAGRYSRRLGRVVRLKQ